MAGAFCVRTTAWNVAPGLNTVVGFTGSLFSPWVFSAIVTLATSPVDLGTALEVDDLDTTEDEEELAVGKPAVGSLETTEDDDELEIEDLEAALDDAGA